MHHVLSIAVGSSLFAFAASATAHIRLDAPQRRNDVAQNISQQAPCGSTGAPRSENPTVLQGGQELTVQWTETINHTGTYRIALLLDGDDFPAPSTTNSELCNPETEAWCIADGIADHSEENYSYSYTFTLPNVDCDNCTLQLIQRDGVIRYYQCADIVIEAQSEPPDGSGGMGGGNGSTGGSDSGTDPDAPPSSSGGAAGDTDSDISAPGRTPAKSGSGCSLSPGALSAGRHAAMFWGGILLPLRWAARRRVQRRMATQR